MNALLEKFVEDMAACGCDRQDTIKSARAMAMSAVALRKKSAGCRNKFREALDGMNLQELTGLIEEIEQLEGGEQ